MKIIIIFLVLPLMIHSTQCDFNKIFFYSAPRDTSFSIKPYLEFKRIKMILAQNSKLHKLVRQY